jgi:hypothetical protein
MKTSTAAGRRVPRDARLTQFRTVLDALIESLDASVRLIRWKEGESKPEALERSAALLLERLGSANRLAAARFVGAPAFVVTSTAIGEAIQALDQAYAEYRRTSGRGPSALEEAAVALDAEIGRIKLDAGKWE